jgi:hypothetical protein
MVGHRCGKEKGTLMGESNKTARTCPSLTEASQKTVALVVDLGEAALGSSEVVVKGILLKITLP